MKKILWLYGASLVVATISLVACEIASGLALRSALYLVGQAFAMVGALALAVRFGRPLCLRTLPLVGLASAALALAGYVILGRPRGNVDLSFLHLLDSARLALAALAGLVTVAAARRVRWSRVDLCAGLTLLALLALAVSDAARQSHYLTGGLIIEGTPLPSRFAANFYNPADVPVLVTASAAALACGAMLGAAVRRRDVRFAGGALATACMLAASLISEARMPWWALSCG